MSVGTIRATEYLKQCVYCFFFQRHGRYFRVDSSGATLLPPADGWGDKEFQAIIAAVAPARGECSYCLFIVMLTPIVCELDEQRQVLLCERRDHEESCVQVRM